jgi:predicted ester cyclase
MSAEENRVLIQRLFKDVLNQGDMGPLDEIISPEHVEHAALPGQDGSGLAGVKLRLATFREAFPDMVWTLEDLVADEEKAVARWSMNATNQGAFMGVAPTGRRNFYGLDIYCIVSGQLTEHWHEIDALGLMQQLGVIHMQEEGRA